MVEHWPIWANTGWEGVRSLKAIQKFLSERSVSEGRNQYLETEKHLYNYVNHSVTCQVVIYNYRHSVYADSMLDQINRLLNIENRNF